jgi:hypothetical protein
VLHGLAAGCSFSKGSFGLSAINRTKVYRRYRENLKWDHSGVQSSIRNTVLRIRSDFPIAILFIRRRTLFYFKKEKEFVLVSSVELLDTIKG